MTTLLTLPVELLLEILATLSERDAKSLIRAQLSGRLLRNLILTISPFAASIKSPTDESHFLPSINPVLRSDFYSVLRFDSSKTHSGTRGHRGGHRVEEAFRALPWARSKRTRDRFQHSDASWRRLPLSDAAPITRVELVSTVMAPYSTATTCKLFESIDNQQSELTIGDLYDLLLSSHMRHNIGLHGWSSYFGKRLRGYGNLESELETKDRAGEEIGGMYLEDCHDTLMILVSCSISCLWGGQRVLEPGWNPKGLGGELKLVCSSIEEGMVCETEDEDEDEDDDIADTGQGEQLGSSLRQPGSSSWCKLL